MPKAKGSIFDADHPKNGVRIPRLFTREKYLKALESASVDNDIRPFATFIAERVQWSLE